MVPLGFGHFVDLGSIAYEFLCVASQKCCGFCFGEFFWWNKNLGKDIIGRDTTHRLSDFTVAVLGFGFGFGVSLLGCVALVGVFLSWLPGMAEL